jgi:glutamyl/glutaminyl-tRNA synthetase
MQLSIAMKLHSRVRPVQRARAALDKFLLNLEQEHQLTCPEILTLLGHAVAHFAAAEWTAPALEAAVTTWPPGQGLELKDIGQPVRVALTGRTASPGLFEVLVILGRDRALGRLTCAAERAERTSSGSY